MENSGIKKSLKNMYADNCFKCHEREVHVAITANIGEIVSVWGEGGGDSLRKSNRS